MVCHPVDPIKLLVNGLGERKRVQGLQERFKLGDLAGIGLGASTDPLERGLGGVVDPFKLGSHPDLAYEFYRGLIQVLIQPQLISVQVVHGGKSLLGIVANIAQELSDVGPVLLLDVGIVIFFVRTAAGEMDFTLITIGLEVIVDEFRAIVGIHSQKLKG